jgi:diguanylate cyclase (GGDEF)-like protein
VRGPLGYLPFIVAGLYCAFLIFILIKRSNKRFLEIVPISLLAVSFASGVVFPFIFGPEFAQIFCPTIAVALFIYYVFSILSLAKKDALTGLLNRQAYYAETSRTYKDITAIVSLDMNGLKRVNDTYGHAAGDEALVTLAICFAKACKFRQSAYRMGGDEFTIVCRKTSEQEVHKLIDRVRKHVSETKYTTSIGYCYQKDGFLGLDDLLKKSDEEMYKNKAEFYKKNKQN